MKAPEAAATARLGEINALREAGDQSFRQALELLRAQAQTKATAAVIADAEQMHRTWQAVRGKIDQELGKPITARATDVVQGAFAQLTLASDTTSKLRQTFETLSSPPSAALARPAMLRDLTADMAEHAGRGRGYLGGIISARTKLGSEQLRNLSMFRGHIDLAWSASRSFWFESFIEPVNRDAISLERFKYSQLIEARERPMRDASMRQRLLRAKLRRSGHSAP